MASNDGRILTDDEVREMSAYHAAGITLPDKFGNVIQDSSGPQGVVYRFATAAEAKAGKEANEAAVAAAEADAALTQKVRDEAVKRGAYVAPPVPPEPGKQG